MSSTLTAAARRQAAIALEQSGKILAQVGVETDLAIALADTGELKAAQDALRRAASTPGSEDNMNRELARAIIAFDAADRMAEPLARGLAEHARNAGSSYFESRAETLLALVLLRDERWQEAQAAADRAVAVCPTPEGALRPERARAGSRCPPLARPGAASPANA